MVYHGDDYLLLATRLSMEELQCLGYCWGCSVDGACDLQDKAERLIRENKDEINGTPDL